jgi:hypothetical protein
MRREEEVSSRQLFINLPFFHCRIAELPYFSILPFFQFSIIPFLIAELSNCRIVELTHSSVMKSHLTR